jgi:hypothetical protein
MEQTVYILVVIVGWEVGKAIARVGFDFIRSL